MAKSCSLIHCVVFIVYIFPSCFFAKIYVRSWSRQDTLEFPTALLQQTKKEPENYSASRLNTLQYPKSDAETTTYWRMFHPDDEYLLNSNRESTTRRKKSRKGLIPYSLERLKELFEKLFGLSAKNDRKSQGAPRPSQKEKSISTEESPTTSPSRQKGLTNTRSENSADTDASKDGVLHWLRSLWSRFRKNFIVFGKATDATDHNEPHAGASPSSQPLKSGDHSDGSPTDDADAEMKERLETHKRLAEKNSIPEERIRTTFLLTDFFAQILRHNQKPRTVVVQLIGPSIPFLYKGLFSNRINAFVNDLMSKLEKNEPLLRQELIKHKGWYHSNENQDVPSTLNDAFETTLKACDELSKKLIDKNWFHQDSKEICLAIQSRTQEWAKLEPDQHKH